jgi:hypothetical protein
VGRRRHGGAEVFEPRAALWAPLWVAERAVCVWLAMAERARGGMPYRGRRLRVAAHSSRHLRRRHRQARQAGQAAAGAGGREVSRSAGTPT